MTKTEQSTVAFPELNPAIVPGLSTDFLAFMRAAISPSGQLWRTWFERVGDGATVQVVNATSTLVIGERELHAAKIQAEGDALYTALVKLENCYHGSGKWWDQARAAIALVDGNKGTK